MDLIYGLNKWDLEHCRRVTPSENHTVLYELPLQDDGLPPKPHRGYKKWDEFHVRLPSSEKSLYPVKEVSSLLTY